MNRADIPTLQKGMHPNDCTFPLTQEQIDNMLPCRLTNPTVGKHHGLKIPDEYDHALSLAELKQVRDDVEHGIFPMWFMKKHYPFKEEWGEFPEEIPAALALEGLSYDDPKGLADVVHMDNPMKMPLALHTWLFNPMYGQNVNVNDHTDKYINFIETVPAVNYAIAKEQLRQVKRAFEVKCYFGTGRPEERYEAETGNPPFPFTSYYHDGSPTHGGFIEGHIALAVGGALGIIESADKDLTHAQTKVILDVTYMWGMFRCFARVHDYIDNIGGMVVERKMRQYLRPEIVKMYLR